MLILSPFTATAVTKIKAVGTASLRRTNAKTRNWSIHKEDGTNLRLCFRMCGHRKKMVDLVALYCQSRAVVDR